MAVAPLLLELYTNGSSAYVGVRCSSVARDPEVSARLDNATSPAPPPLPNPAFHTDAGTTCVNQGLMEQSPTVWDFGFRNSDEPLMCPVRNGALEMHCYSRQQPASNRNPAEACVTLNSVVATSHPYSNNVTVAKQCSSCHNHNWVV